MVTVVAMPEELSLIMLFKMPGGMGQTALWSMHLQGVDQGALGIKLDGNLFGLISSISNLTRQ